MHVLARTMRIFTGSSVLVPGALLFVFAVCVPVVCASEEAGPEHGLFLGTDEHDRHPAALLSALVEVRISGTVARTTVTQVFANDTDQHIGEALFVFPLPDTGAIDTLRLVVGERVIEGRIEELQEAKATYRKARASGVVASIVEQRSRDVFQTAVANIAPRETVEVVLGFQQPVLFRDAAFRFRMPLVVMPRYTPTRGLPLAPVPEAEPDRVASVSGGPAGAVALRIDLQAGMPLAEISSPTHALAVERSAPGRAHIELDHEVITPDGDLVVVWRPEQGTQPIATAIAQQGGDGDRGDDSVFLQLLLVPPVDAVASRRMPREMIFVLDTSGSMQPVMAQARAALHRGLASLAPGDRFNVIPFSSQPASLFPSAVAASEEALAQGRSFVDALQAHGGTEIGLALAAALEDADPPATDHLRQVVFVTDGRVSNEDALYALIEEQLGRTRLFTVGIGAAPNASFMRKAAAAGRGTYTFIDRADHVAEVMDALIARLAAPSLRDLQIEWGDGVAGAPEVFPDPLPDLYQAAPLGLVARLDALPRSLLVRGWREGALWERRVTVAEVPRSAGLDKLWAKRAVERLEAQVSASPERFDAIRRDIVDLGKRFGLQTRFTSLVAVDDSGFTRGKANLVGRVVDRDGQSLPGTIVTLTGTGAPRRAVTDHAGSFRFVGLAAGQYGLLAELDGFSTADFPAVTIGGGRTSTIEINLSSAIEETITLTSESPLLDERKIGLSSTVDGLELDRLPTAHDLLTILRTIPGVLVDRVDVGTNLVGRTASSVSVLGSDPAGATWALDGLELTGPLGQKVPIVEIDHLEAIDVVSGGGDVRSQTAGPRIDLVGKRGTNQFRGSARHRHAWSDDAPRQDPDDLGRPGPWNGGNAQAASAEAIAAVGRAHRLEGSDDTGFELGGPLKRDGLWMWGALGRREIERFDFEGRSERGRLDVATLGLNAQLGPAGSLVASGYRETYLEQTLVPASPRLSEREGRFAFGKLQSTYVVSSNLYFDGLGARLERREICDPEHVARFGITCIGDADQEQLGASGATFFNLLSSNHEVVFGGRYRDLEAPLFPSPDVPADLGHGSLFVQDTMTAGKLTTRFGLRLDEQRGRLDPGARSIRWRNLQPRLGVTYAFGANRQTLLRFAAGRYVDRLLPQTALGSRNVLDGALESPVTDEAVLAIEHGFLPELVVGLEAAVRRGHGRLRARPLVLDAADGRLRPAERGDFVHTGWVSGVLPDGAAFTLPVYGLAAPRDPSGGFTLDDGGPETMGHSLSATFHKRLVNRWMARGHFSWSDGRVDQDDRAGRVDPNRGLAGLPGPVLVRGQAPFEESWITPGWSFAFSGLVQIAPDRPWAFHVIADLYGRQGFALPYRVEVPSNSPLHGGQGRADLPLTLAVTPSSDSVRMPDVLVAALRFDKEIRWRDLGMTIGFDVYNLFDRHTPLQRDGVLSAEGTTRSGQVVPLTAASGDWLRERLAGRTWRLGVKLNW